ncbi:MAG: class I SAM-dependent methyltransferase [Chitinispirillaceae bacterium]|nr:class I SAM-dependent methyltransferase [Chitinispirillaceae bacterium]
MLVQQKKHSARILDVGCGQGDLLRDLKNESTFSCEGVEPVEHAAGIARSHGIPVTCSTLEEAHFPSGKFDLVIMNHVLEHLPEPGRVIDEVFRILNKGGIISGETPCSRAVERLLFGPYWSMYHLPRHLTYFSPGLLFRFLRQHGFTGIRLSLQPQPSSWQASVRNYLNDRNAPSWLSQMFNGHSPVVNVATFPFSWIFARLGFAPIVRFIAKKKVHDSTEQCAAI